MHGSFITSHRLSMLIEHMPNSATARRCDITAQQGSQQAAQTIAAAAEMQSSASAGHTDVGSLACYQHGLVPAGHHRYTHLFQHAVQSRHRARTHECRCEGLPSIIKPTSAFPAQNCPQQPCCCVVPAAQCISNLATSCIGPAVAVLPCKAPLADSSCDPVLLPCQQPISHTSASEHACVRMRSLCRHTHMHKALRHDHWHVGLGYMHVTHSCCNPAINTTAEPFHTQMQPSTVR